MTAETRETERRDRALRRAMAPVRAWSRELIVLDNPFTTRDARSRVRGMRFPILLLVYHAATILFGLIGVLAYRASSGYGAEKAAGQVVFPYLAYTQIVLAPMVSAAFTATAITSEREKQSLDLLTVTTLRGIEVAVGKAAAPWALTFLVAATSLPYTLFCSIAGGVSVGQIATFYVGLGLFCGLLASVGIMFSSMARSSVLSVILTVALYLAGLIASLVMMVIVDELRHGGPAWAESMTAVLGLFPTTWVAAVLEPEVATFGLAGLEVPFWIPGVLLWGAAIAYMLLVASCRAGTSQTRHLIARRVLGFVCWFALFATGAHLMLGVLTPTRALSHTFSLLGQSGTELTILVLLVSCVTVVAAIVAAAATLGECESFAAHPLRRMALGLPRVLSPSPEGGIPFALFIWATAVALVLAGIIGASAGTLPLRWDVILALGLPQVGVILYCGFAGLWANLRHGGGTRQAKNTAVALVGPLLLWPVVALVATLAAVSGALQTPLQNSLMRGGVFLMALSPFSYGPLAGITGLTDWEYLALWYGQVHPAHAAGAMSVLLAGLMGAGLLLRAVRGKTSAELRTIRNTGPASGVQEEAFGGPRAEPGSAE